MTVQIEKDDATAVYTAFAAIILIVMLLALWGEYIYIIT
jgi:hypothetical protein